MWVESFVLFCHYFQDLIQKLASEEAILETAVDQEDYDRAAELSEIVDNLKDEIQQVRIPS